MSRKQRTATTKGWERGLAEADLTLWLTDTVLMPFRRVPPGEFWMGSRGDSSDEEPRHLVRITRPFFMATFPTTQHQYRAVVGRKRKHGLDPSPSRFKGDLRPTENVSLNDAMQWCDLLQSKPCLRTAEITLGQGSLNVVLPSEAQWEFACRAGTDTEYYTGDGEASLDEAGWYDGNSDGETHDVGKKTPNDFRLYDMHGNVWEWSADAYDQHAYKKQVNGSCEPFINGERDPDRVVRGGSWYFSPRNCRAAFRNWRRPGNRGRNQGFQACLFPSPCPDKPVRAEQAS